MYINKHFTILRIIPRISRGILSLNTDKCTNTWNSMSAGVRNHNGLRGRNYY